MSTTSYNGTEIVLENVVDVSPVVERVKSMANTSPILKYGFNITTTHNVIKSPDYDTSSAADSARTAFIALL